MTETLQRGSAVDLLRKQLRGTARWWPTVRVGLLLALVLAPASALGATFRSEIGDGLVAAQTDRQELFLEAPPRPREGLLAFTLRFCGTVDPAETVAEANGGVKRLLAGVRYRVPYSLLLPEYQRQVIEALFAEDRPVPEGWSHTVKGRGRRQRESLWRLAEWFTGGGENYRGIREYNSLADEEIYPEQTLVIPTELLLPAFRSAVEVVRMAQPSHSLEYARDQVGEYASYRLEPGEALYSSVVIRFTGRIYAEDVNPLALEIAERSGIEDVTDIPVGYEVKIPLDVLSPEYLPPEHPRRREYEANLIASGRFTNQVRALDLGGITVILDAGHGGKDVGASVDGVWESVYVYDIMLRIKGILETVTAAAVLTTTRDGGKEHIEDRDVLTHSREHAVLTTPPYPIEDSRTGVVLRWYLANSMYRHTLERLDNPEKVVFLSVHADSLHPSLRGAMVYVPGLLRMPSNYGKTGSVYMSRKEVREQPTVSFSKHERTRSEGLSRNLANGVIEAFRRRDLLVHPNKPVRDKVVRRRREWVPAILRYNAVPAKILVEVCNLANEEDRRSIQTQSFRQEVAEAIVDGILQYYGREIQGVQVAETAGR